MELTPASLGEFAGGGERDPARRPRPRRAEDPRRRPRSRRCRGGCARRARGLLRVTTQERLRPAAYADAAERLPPPPPPPSPPTLPPPSHRWRERPLSSPGSCVNPSAAKRVDARAHADVAAVAEHPARHCACTRAPRWRAAARAQHVARAAGARVAAATPRAPRPGLAASRAEAQSMAATRRPQRRDARRGAAAVPQPPERRGIGRRALSAVSWPAKLHRLREQHRSAVSTRHGGGRCSACGARRPAELSEERCWVGRDVDAHRCAQIRLAVDVVRRDEKKNAAAL